MIKNNRPRLNVYLHAPFHYGQFMRFVKTRNAAVGDELYNAAAGTGLTYTFPPISFTTLGNREAFTTTSSGQTEAFYRQ